MRHIIAVSQNSRASLASPSFVRHITFVSQTTANPGHHEAPWMVLSPSLSSLGEFKPNTTNLELFQFQAVEGATETHIESIPVPGSSCCRWVKLWVFVKMHQSLVQAVFLAPKKEVLFEQRWSEQRRLPLLDITDQALQEQSTRKQKLKQRNKLQNSSCLYICINS